MQRKIRRQIQRRLRQKVVKALWITAAAAGLLFGARSYSLANPTDGTVTSGSATISASGNTMTITQTTDTAAINWTSFSIDLGETVTLVQPESSSIAVNRVTGTDASAIYGTLSANGQVYLINPNGILFSSTAQVNVGGIVAATLDISDTDFAKGNYIFSGSGGSVVNEGSIAAGDGGYVALLGGTVSNTGTITANSGAVALGAGSQITLDFDGDGLLSLTVDSSVLGALAANGGIIQVDGGTVLLSASAADTLGGTVVNNSGTIRAQSISNVNGTIVLNGGTDGMVINRGTLDVLGTDSGESGGTVEMTGENVTVAAGGGIDASGAASGGTVSLSAAGDITVNGTIVDTGGNGAVTLRADSDADSGGTVMFGDSGSVTADGTVAIYYNPGGRTTTTVNGATVEVKDYTNVTDYSGNVSGGGTLTAYLLVNNIIELQAVSLNLAGTYALGSDIDASATATWNYDGDSDVYLGFDPIGSSAGSAFSGSFDGNGYTISGLTINRSASNYVGLFGYSSGSISNVGLVGGGITGKNFVGGLVGRNNGGTISASYATGTVDGVSYIGGLIGYSISGKISASYATGDVSGTGNDVGGLVGVNHTGPIADSYATGTVSGADNVGGLAGYNAGTIESSYATGNVSGAGDCVGGLVGKNYYEGTISSSYATGDVSGVNSVGGLVGHNYYAASKYRKSIDSCYATGDVSGTDNNVGGLVGYNYCDTADTEYAIINNSYATGDVSGTESVGGLTGYNYCGTISASYATGDVGGVYNVGGLVGDNYHGTVSYCYATGDANGTGWEVGGLAGTNLNGTISASYATGMVSGTDYDLGGLVGYNGGTVSNCYWDVDTTGQTAGIGGGTTSGAAISITGLTSQGTSGYADAFDQDSYSGWDFDDIWYMADGYTRPFLRSEYSGAISNAHQLQLVALDLDANYTLATDIDLNELTEDSGLWRTENTADSNGEYGFVPIGSAGSAFTGSLDGNGYIISGLIIYRPATDYVGLLGFSAGSISKVGLVDAAVSGAANVGALVGYNGDEGELDICYVTASSDATATISGAANVGGLAGANYGAISNCYGATEVTAADNVGGLAGYNAGTIEYSYAAGMVSGSNNVGGLAGTNAGTIGNCYWDVDTTGTTTGIGGGTLSGATGLTSEGTSGYDSVYSTSSYSGWDLAIEGGSDCVWRIYEGYTYPLLRSFLTSLTVAADSVSKTYDGSAYTGALANVSYTTADGSTVDNATDLVSGKLSYGSESDAGTYTLTGLYSGQQGYDISYDSGSTLTISKATLTISAVNDSKTYDGTTTSNATPTVAGLQPGDSLTGVVEEYNDKNAGTGKTLTVTGYTLDDGANGGNYDVVLVDNTDGTITKATLTITATTDSKTYDGTTTSAVVATYSGLQTGDTLSDIVEAYDDKNAGADKTLMVTGYTLDDGNNGGNYDVVLVDNTDGTIAKATLTITATTDSKTYDGTTASAAVATYSGLQTGDTLSDIVEAYDDRNVGAGKTLTVTGYTLDDGANCGNYDVVLVDNTAGAIAKATLTITAASDSKTYDGTIASVAVATVEGLQTGDTLTGVVEEYSDKNVGTGKTLTVTGYTLDDGDNGGNYNVVLVENATGTIGKAPLTITVATDSKTYDGTTASDAVATYSGLQTGDTLSDIVEEYDDKNAGTGKTMTVTSYTLDDGANGGNYDVVLVDNTDGTITKATLTITATTDSKTYDGTTTSAVVATYSGLQTGDTLSDIVEAYDDKNAGAGKTLMVTGYTLDDGNNGGNYDVVLVDNMAGTIAKATLTIIAASDSKTYDGTTASVAVATVEGLRTGDTLTGVVEEYSDKNAGTGKTLTVTGYTLDDGDNGGNYNVILVDNTTGTISKATLTITANDATWIIGGDEPQYSASYTGLVADDIAADLDGTLEISTSGTADSGIGKYAITASGLSSANYNITYVDGVLTVRRIDYNAYTGAVGSALKTKNMTLTEAGDYELGILGLGINMDGIEFLEAQ